jgi:NADPH-dependent 2,4-dienoyl-CoA reductase/sulfur reductase-like enzyme
VSAERVVVVGGDAAGMSAASQAKRLRGDGVDVVALERGTRTSYSACGIPYWVAGDVGSADALVSRTPEQHRANGIDVRVRAEAVSLDMDAREVEVRDHGSGSTYRLGFDHLVLATGAVPVRPELPGVDAAGIFGVQTLDDGEAVITDLAGLAGRNARRNAVVVGGGYIGIEMAEALHRHGLHVTVVDQADEPMTTLDPDMGGVVHEAMEEMGCEVLTGLGVDGFEADGSGRVRAVVAGGRSLPADVVVLGLGVRPNAALARDAGLPVGDSGGIRTDLRMVVPGHDRVWAAGDCVESFDRISKSWVHVPLGTHANKQGRVAGINIGGGYATFPGIVRTAISKVCDLEIARTGLREADARRAGFRYEAVRIESSTRAGYFPGTEPMTVKMLAERGSGRLLGVQIVGREGAAKRIDACAVALWNGMTVEEMTGLDLAYAPPFSPVWDPVLVAARKAADRLRSG